jgi:hypothetical protein
VTYCQLGKEVLNASVSKKIFSLGVARMCLLG